MFIRFYLQPVESGTSEDDGLPLYRDVEFITINRDATHTVSREVSDEDRKMFRELYEPFRDYATKQEKVEGFPIEEWAALRPAEVQNIRLRGIRTVQQLAAKAGDQNPLMAEYGKRAQLFMALNKGAEAAKKFEALNQELEMLRGDLKEAQNENAILRSKLKELQT